MIYLARCGEYYKIGYTRSDAEKRISSLQTGNPELIELVGVIPGNEADERLWHMQFAEKRVRGEWFALDEADVKHILSLESPLERLLRVSRNWTSQKKEAFAREMLKIRAEIDELSACFFSLGVYFSGCNLL